MMSFKNNKKQDFRYVSRKTKILLSTITYVSYLYLFYTNLAIKSSIIKMKNYAKGSEIVWK